MSNQIDHETLARLCIALEPGVYDQPDADAVHAPFDRIIDSLGEKLPAVAVITERPKERGQFSTGVDISRVRDGIDPDEHAQMATSAAVIRSRNWARLFRRVPGPAE